MKMCARKNVPSQTLPTEWRRCRMLFCCSGDHEDDDACFVFYYKMLINFECVASTTLLKYQFCELWWLLMNTDLGTLKDPERAGDERPLAMGDCCCCVWMSPTECLLCRLWPWPAPWPVCDTTTEFATSPIPWTNPDINSDGHPDAILLQTPVKTRLNFMRRRSIFWETSHRRMSSGWFLRTVSAQSVLKNKNVKNYVWTLKLKLWV